MTWFHNALYACRQGCSLRLDSGLSDLHTMEQHVGEVTLHTVLYEIACFSCASVHAVLLLSIHVLTGLCRVRVLLGRPFSHPHRWVGQPLLLSLLFLQVRATTSRA
jgi:hypothetical protein